MKIKKILLSLAVMFMVSGNLVFATADIPIRLQELLGDKIVEVNIENEIAKIILKNDEATKQVILNSPTSFSLGKEITEEAFKLPGVTEVEVYLGESLIDWCEAGVSKMYEIFDLNSCIRLNQYWKIQKNYWNFQKTYSPSIMKLWVPFDKITGEIESQFAEVYADYLDDTNSNNCPVYKIKSCSANEKLIQANNPNFPGCQMPKCVPVSEKPIVSVVNNNIKLKWNCDRDETFDIVLLKADLIKKETNLYPTNLFLSEGQVLKTIAECKANKSYEEEFHNIPAGEYVIGLKYVAGSEDIFTQSNPFKIRENQTNLDLQKIMPIVTLILQTDNEELKNLLLAILIQIIKS